MIVVAMIFCLSGTSLGQAGQGALQGTAKDQTGAVLPGVSVSATDLATQIKRETITNDIGLYRFLSLPVGAYEIQAVLPGFKTTTLQNVRIEGDRTSVVDFQMEVGIQGDSVLVTDVVGKMVETTSAAVSNLISEQKMRDLPLNGRDWAQLALLQTGTAPSVNTGAYSEAQGAAGFVNGTRTYSNNFSLDGADFNDPVVPGGAAVPVLGGGGITMDAIQEFRVTTAAADAEWGVTAGAQINVITKRGANDLHGTAFEYFRNDILDARNFFDYGTGKTGGKKPFRRNLFGFTFGGPIKKDKTFYFGSYEGFRQRLLNSRIPGVPTPRLLAQIPGGAANGYLREVMELYYPKPTPGFDPQALVAPYYGFQNSRTDRNQFSGRVDHPIGGGHDFTSRYVFLDSKGPPGALDTPGFSTVGQSFSIRTHNFSLSDTWTISPTKLNQLRVAYNRNGFVFGCPPYPEGITRLGFSEDRNGAGSIPGIAISGTGIASITTCNDSSGRVQGTYHIQDTFSWTSGRHSLKWGSDFRRVQDNEISKSRRRSATFVGFGPPFDNAANGITTGRAFSMTQRFFNNPTDGNRYLRVTQGAFYVNDNYRVTDRLSMNLGLRYELIWPMSEAKGNFNNIFQADASGKPIKNGALSDISRIALVPVSEFPLTKFDKNNLAPRVGFSWDVFGTGKTTLRGSYSIFYNQVALVGYRGGGTNPPFIIDTSVSNVSYGFFADPKVHGLTPALAGIAPDSVTGYVQYYTFGVQREIPSKTIVEINYVATKGTHLDRQRRPNMGPGFRGTRPNPRYADISMTENSSSSIYHSLQIEVNRPIYKGMAFQSAYTFSKAIDDASDQRAYIPQFQNELHPERGLADFDVRHNWVLNYMYDLPWGVGRRFLSNPGVVDKILGGWTFSGITQIATGSPFSLRAGSDQNGDGFTNDRPVFRGARLEQLLVGKSGDKTQFLRDPGGLLVIDRNAGPFDTMGRNVLTGPGMINFDMSVMKRLKLTEKVEYELQWSAFNVFNTPMFDISERRTPSFNNISSPLFGRILRTRVNSREMQIGMKLRW